ncbi:MAG: response regulator transcription factor [Pirellulaceae bacterium]|nr:response regulator transcription factor [Pirellulaceae bacterium]
MSISTSHCPRGAKRRLMIVDDHPIVRRGLAELLARELDVEVCGGADNVADALVEVETLHPDLVVVDMSLRDSHGIELIIQIAERWPDVKMLAWSMFDEKIFAERAVQAGAMGYLNKKEPIENVVHAIRQVFAGDMYLSPRMTQRLLRRACGGVQAEDDPIQSLSDRELQVFEMLGRGMTTKEIAAKLDLSPKTIEAHREKIKAKLDLANAAALSRRAVLWVLENG